MIDYAQKVRDAEQYGIIPVPGQGLFRLMVRGQRIAELSPVEADILAAGLAHRLDVVEVLAVPTGIAGRVGDNQTVHLCYSDQAEDFARSVMAAAGRNGVTW